MTHVYVKSESIPNRYTFLITGNGKKKTYSAYLTIDNSRLIER